MVSFAEFAIILHLESLGSLGEVDERSDPEEEDSGAAPG
jgi:hypothetical protein